MSPCRWQTAVATRLAAAVSSLPAIFCRAWRSEFFEFRGSPNGQQQRCQFWRAFGCGAGMGQRLASLAGYHSQAIDYRSARLGIGVAPQPRRAVDLQEVRRVLVAG